MRKKEIYKDIFIRAIKTFLQGFLASFVLSLNSMTSIDENLLKSALLGALAGGFSALMNFMLKLLERGGANMEEEVKEVVAEETVAEATAEESVVEETEVVEGE